MPVNDLLLEVKGLKKYYPVKKGILKKTVGYVKAVDGVDFSIRHGETFGLVGESGCGKTTIGKSVLRLTEATDGQIIFDCIDILKLEKEELRKTRRHMQIIFQDPYGSLNPRMMVNTITITNEFKNHPRIFTVVPPFADVSANMVVSLI